MLINKPDAIDAKADNAAYIAIIIDLRRSRLLSASRRDAVQERLRRLIADLPPEWTVAQPSIIRGDEVQFLSRRPRHALDLCWRMLFDLHPQLIRCGIGVGRLYTIAHPLAKMATLELDGPCFHAARAAIETAKRERYWIACDYRGPRHRVLNAPFIIAAFNQIGALQSAVLAAGLEPAIRVERVAALRRYWAGQGVVAIAADIGKSKGNISTLLARSHAGALRSSAARQLVQLRALQRMASAGTD